MNYSIDNVEMIEEKEGQNGSMMTPGGVWVMYDEYVSGTSSSNRQDIMSTVLFEVVSIDVMNW